MTEINDKLTLSLKLIMLERDKTRRAEILAGESSHYIFTPKNAIETAAIALAIEGEAGWKGSLYSLDYFDRHLEHICFIFATQPKEKSNCSWLLVAFNSNDRSKYWIALGKKLLPEVYYAWAKVVQNNKPRFDFQRMEDIDYAKEYVNPR